LSEPDFAGTYPQHKSQALSNRGPAQTEGLRFEFLYSPISPCGGAGGEGVRAVERGTAWLYSQRRSLGPIEAQIIRARDLWRNQTESEKSFCRRVVRYKRTVPGSRPPHPARLPMKCIGVRSTLPDLWGPMVRSDRTRNRTPPRGTGKESGRGRIILGQM
jgi:hypothetical protein